MPTSSASAVPLAPISNTPVNSPRVHEDTSLSNTAVASPQDLNQQSGLNMLHLELLHNFITSTSLTLSGDQILRNIWRINVPRLAFSFDFIMHAILALSALHMARSPGKRDFYESQAALLYQNGLRLATSLLPHVTPENCSALYIFAALSCVITLASPRKLGDILLVSETGVAEWLLHIRGIRSVIASAEAEIRSGPLGPMFIAGQRRFLIREAHSNDQTVEADQLDKLLQHIKENLNNDRDLEVYTAAIRELRGSFNVTYAVGFQGYESADVYIWLFRIPDDYLSLLSERRQEALTIYAFFCVVLKRFDTSWYMSGWCSHILSRIFYLLDEHHRLWIQWPIEETGLILY